MALDWVRFGRSVLVAGVAATALTLSACGVKGPLEPPPGSAALAPPPDGAAPAKADADAPKPPDHFFLDFLI